MTVENLFRFEAGLEVEMVIRLLLAAIFGAAVGFERQQAEKPAGLRTLSLVTVGAAMFTMAGLVAFPGADPARLAAQIVTGVGFLGAGTILHAGVTVRGLTTAASIWAVAAVGITVGAGMYVLSFVATILMLVILHFLPKEM